METIVRNVRDLDHSDRSALERVVGHQLSERQKVVVNVVDLDAAADASEPKQRPQCGGIPEWWNIYDGLTDEEIDRLDQAVRRRADLTRDFE
jgi:hypothetical protein